MAQASPVDLAGVRMAPIAAGVLLAHVGDGGLGVSALDLECGDQRVLGLDGDLIRLAPDLDPNSIPDAHASGLPDPSKTRRLHVGMPTRLAAIGPTFCALTVAPISTGSAPGSPSCVDCLPRDAAANGLLDEPVGRSI